MEHCCHFWAGASGCYLEKVDKLQKWICRAVGPSHAASLELLAKYQNIASLVFSIRITLEDVHLNHSVFFITQYAYDFSNFRFSLCLKYA